MKANKRKLLFKDAFFCLILSTALIALLSFIVLNLSIFNPFTGAFKDFSFLDIYYSEGMYEPKHSNDVVLVNVEHVDRFQIQQLLQHVQNQNPKVIAMDIIFKGNRDPFVDSLLQVQLQKPNVVQAKAYVEQQWDYDFSNLTKHLEKTGFTNLNFGSKDNVIRKFQGFKEIDDTLHTSLSTAVVKNYREQWPPEALIEKLSQEQTIAYSGNFSSFLTFSYEECMAAEEIPVMKNKIVILGYLGTPHASVTDIEDKFFTPLNSVSAGKSTPDMFGPLIHANIIEMILRGDYFLQIPTWVMVLCALILTYFGLALFMWLNRRHPPSYMLTKKLSQLGMTILLLWFSLWLFKNKIVFSPELIIAFFVISVDFIGLHVIISKKLNSKYKWQSFFFHD